MKDRDPEKVEKVVEEAVNDTSEDLDADKYAAAIVPQTDDPTIPSFTFRALILGTFWCVALAVANAILAFRTNSFVVDAMLANLLTYPLGKFLAAALPAWTIRLPFFSFSLNPGPFSVKEHVLVSIMATAGASGAYGIDNVIVQKSELYIGNGNIGFAESLSWVFATQFIGYGLAGITRRFLVKPKAMLWPGILGYVALFVTLHQPDVPVGRWAMSRFSFFWIAFLAIFAYTWVPEYLMTSLQMVSWLCFLSKDKLLRFLGSGSYGGGIGLGSLTFDWYYIGSVTLTTPFVYYLNFMAGNILSSYILAPILYYTNPFGSPKYVTDEYPDGSGMMPTLNGVDLYNRTGHPVPARSMMNKQTFNLDEEIFEQYKPIYITEYFALSYLSNFLALAATFSHVGLWYGKNIVKQFKQAMRQQHNVYDDVHNNFMKAYKEVPEWAYIVFLGGCIAFMCVVVTTTHFHMPIWAVFLGVGITGIALIPLGTIEAITGTRIYLNVLSQMIIGLLLPGKTIDVMAFKSLGTNSALQALSLIADLKVGHYMKIPPIAMVTCQLYGTLVGALTCVCTSWFVMHGMKDLIGKGDWGAVGFRTFYNAGAIWGAIGPRRFFGIGTPYETLLLGFLIGFLGPFIPWGLNKLYPSNFWKYINIPLIVYTTGPGGFQNFIVVPFIVNWFFGFYLMKYHHDWWKKYNYVLAAAVSGAVSICVLCISVLRNLHVSPPIWPGNPDLANGMDVDYYCWDKPYAVPAEA